MKPGSSTMLRVSLLATTFAYLLHLALCFMTVELGYEVSRARKNERALQEARKLLELEVATLTQIDRVEAVARGTLGMEVPSPEHVIAVGPGRGK